MQNVGRADRRAEAESCIAVSRAILVVLGLCALLPWSVTTAAQETDSAQEAWEVLEERPAAGEQCLVCRQLIDYGDIVEIRYKGRVFHVSAGMVDDFKADPDRYFYVMQARSGLFDEASVETPAMSMGWLGFGIYVLLGLVFGAATAYAALNRGLPARKWFVAGMLVNVVALVVLLVSKREAERHERGLSKIPTTPSPLACANCRGTNHPLASECSSCGHALRPSGEPETARA